MKDITHEILSEIHHLLSIATEDELRRVGNLPNTSPHLRAALNSLASEKISTAKRGRTKASDATTSYSHASDERRNTKSNMDGFTREIVRSLGKLSKSDIQDLCNSAGLPLTVKAKDARGRIIQRLARMVIKLPDEQKDRLFSALRIKADTQTEGWVGVIRKGQ